MAKKRKYIVEARVIFYEQVEIKAKNMKLAIEKGVKEIKEINPDADIDQVTVDRA
jgi:hypothetical protein